MAMTELKTLEELGEEITFLLNELTISSDLLVNSLELIMSGLKSGLSLQSLELEEKLMEPQQYSDVVAEVLKEYEKSLGDFIKVADGIQSHQPENDFPSGLLGEIPSLKTELNFWGTFLKQVDALLNRLNLILEDGQLTPLGRGPIEDAWEEIVGLVSGRLNSDG